MAPAGLLTADGDVALLQIQIEKQTGHAGFDLQALDGVAQAGILEGQLESLQDQPCAVISKQRLRILQIEIAAVGLL